MVIPEELNNLCKACLEGVYQDPAHQLNIEERYKVYNALNPTRANYSQPKPGRGLGNDNAKQFRQSNVGDFALYWLALITIEKVGSRLETKENISDQENKYLNTVEGMLQLGKDLILKKVSFEEAHDRLLDEFWYFSHFFVTYEYACLYNAAVLALAVIMYCDNMGLGGSRENYSLDNYIGTMDFAWEAAKAFTLTDNNLPGAVELQEIQTPVDFDPAKRLEFWEWWLTIGVTQAHELAQQTILGNTTL